MAKRDYRPLREGMANVQRLVFSAFKMDQYDEEQIRVRLMYHRRGAYESELEWLAADAGCPGRRADLTNGAILSALNEVSRRDAESIVNTYNHDLARAIMGIAADAPRANRYVYASRLRGWEERRSRWKGKQIAEYTLGSARGMAQRNFYSRNKPEGVARLEPRTGVCPVCRGWIARGLVRVRVAFNNPGPFHVGCPHSWSVTMGQYDPDQCASLWLGE